MNMNEYAEANGITVKRGRDFGWREDDNWRHYRMDVYLYLKPGKAMRVAWRQGEAHEDATPSAGEVLNAVVLDAMSFESSMSFEDFAQEFGYDLETDRMKAKKAWNACGTMFSNLNKILGPDEYENLTTNIESL